MQTAYFIAIAIVGGLVFAFLAMGWTSYKEKKVPEKPVIFRWFIAGLVSAGLGAYAWIFGAGGDVQGAIKAVTESLEVESIINIGKATEEVVEAVKEELTVGMPSF
jgi:hypothetical protein